MVVERSSQSAQVVLVGNSTTAEPFAACLDLIRERLGSELHSLWFNSNTAPTNTILGTEFHLWHGPQAVIERFGGAAIHYPPGAFGQSNLEIAEQMVAHVRSETPEGSRVAEFYAGVGAFGLSVLDRASAMQLNEVAPQSLLGLEQGLAELAPADRAMISVTPGTAGAAREIALDANVVIADPPTQRPRPGAHRVPQ